VRLLPARVLRGLPVPFHLRGPPALLSLSAVRRRARDPGCVGGEPPPPNVLEITLGPDLRALLRGELLSAAEECDLELEIPDFPPEGWGEPGREASD
jgi:hypothetical protein